MATVGWLDFPWNDRNTRFGRFDALAFLVWLLLLASILITPYAVHSPTLGDDLVRSTVRLALVYYAAAASLMLVFRSRDWLGWSATGRLARWCWTLA